MKRILNIALLLAAAPVVAQVSTPAALKSELLSATQASIISLEGVDPVDCPEVSMSNQWNGGVMFFSNSPESPTNRGMLYMDTNVAATASGVPNRVFAYHANGDSSTDLRFSVLISNNSSSSGTLTVVQDGIAGPSTDYAYVGKLAFLRWLTNAAFSSVTVPAHGVVRLDTNFDTMSVAETYAMQGIWDYTFTQPHTVMVCALYPTDNPVTVGPTLSVLPRDTHIRGTMEACNKIFNTATNVVIDTASGIQQYPIGGNDDLQVTGYDNSVQPPTAVTNNGNYGLLYRIHMQTSASDGQDMAFLMTPRSGSWGGAVYAEAGLLAGGYFFCPSGTGTFSDETEAAVEGEYSPGSGLTVWLQFMPTSGSSFPIRMMAVPY